MEEMKGRQAEGPDETPRDNIQKSASPQPLSKTLETGENMQDYSKILQESEERFRTLGENLPLVVSLARPDGTIEYINNWWTQFSGRSLEDFISGDWLGAIHPDDTPHVLSGWQTALATGEAYSYEFRALSKNGIYRWLFARGVPTRDANGNITHWINTALDIHDRKEAEEKVKGSEVRQAYLLTLSDALRSLSDATEIQATATATAMNHFGADRCYYCEIEGDDAIIRRDASSGDSPSVVGTYPLSSFPLLKAVIDTGRPFVVQDANTTDLLDEGVRQLCLQMGIISFLDVPIIKDGKPAGVLCITQTAPREWTELDVQLALETAERTWAAVERANAEEAMRESEEKYRTLFNSIDEGFCLLEVLFDKDEKPFDYRFHETNPAFELQSGLTNAKGKTILGLVPGLEPQWMEIYGRIAKTGVAERFEADVESMGRVFDIYAFRSGESGANLVGVIFNDITERKRHEANLAFLAEVSQHLARLTNIDDTMNALGAKIAAHFGLSACVFAELFGENEEQIAELTHGWHRADTPSLLGTYQMREFMTLEMIQMCRAEESIIIRDVFADPKTEGEQYAKLNIGSFIGVPLVRDGEWRFLLVVYRSEPHDWSADEIALVRELTTRIWTRLERARAEVALRESEARFRNMADHAPVMVWMTESDASCSFLSQSWYDFTGQTLEMGLGFGWLTATHPEDCSESERIFKQANERQEAFSLEYRLRAKDGTYRWCIDSAQPRFSSSGEFLGYIGSVLDITERRQAEEMVRFQASLLQAVDQSVVTTDMAGRITFWNRFAEKLFGYKPEEVIGKLVQDVTPATFVKDQAEEIMTDLLQGGSWSGEFFVQRKDGSVFPAFVTNSPIYDGQGKQTGIVGISFDLTQRKRAEEALRESEEKYRSLFTTMDEGFCIIEKVETARGEPSDFRYLMANPAFERHTGLHDVIGKTIHELVPSAEQDIMNNYDAVIQTGQQRHFEAYVSRLDMWMDAQVFPTQQPGQLAVLFSNVTERKRAVESLKASAEALREADKRKDEFLAVLAHELRNPLAPIRTSLEILKRTKNKEIEAEARAIIERQTNQMVRLIDDLLDISRITRDKINMQKEKVELSEIVNLAVESSRPLIEEKEQHLTVSLPEEKVVLEGDKMRLAQALLNLLNNAAKYTPSGGDITVEAEREDHHVGIHVKDTGAGIPSEKLSEIFELFTRLERDRGQEGLGIGLNLVKQIVELHGGDIEAHSPGLEQGSEFTIHLPVTEIVQQESQDVKETQESPSNSRRVLVIDDYAPNLKTLARLLRIMGHEVRTAGGGEEGLGVLKEFRAHVILLDLNMPGMNGFETARRIRERLELQKVKLVALTGYGQEEDIARTLATGFDSHLVKPVDVEKLERVLES